MNLRSVDLNLLTVFDAVMAEGNMSRAAEKIGMSQPALSLAISRFRHVAKDELFENSGRGVKPTPRALQLAVPIRRALDLVSGALEQDSEFDIQHCDRIFKLVLSDYGEVVLLPRLIKYLEDSGSSIRIKTLSAAGKDLVKEMHFGNIDLYAWVEPIEHPEFISHQMGTIREVCLVRNDHPTVKDSLTIKQYADLDHIILDMSEKYGPSSVDRELWSHDLKRKNALSVHTYFDVPSILATSDMVCSVPQQLARRFCEAYPLKIVPSPIGRDLPAFLIWHKSMNEDQAHRWLREYLIELNERI